MKEVLGPTVKRLVQYYRYLDELERNDGEQIISSVMLGKGVGGFATQIRKDLSSDIGSLFFRLNKEDNSLCQN